MTLALSTPRGTLNTTASALNREEQPVCVDRACTSTPAGTTPHTPAHTDCSQPTISGIMNGRDFSVEPDIQTLGQRGWQLVIAISQSQVSTCKRVVYYELGERERERELTCEFKVIILVPMAQRQFVQRSSIGKL